MVPDRTCNSDLTPESGLSRSKCWAVMRWIPCRRRRRRSRRRNKDLHALSAESRRCVGSASRPRSARAGDARVFLAELIHAAGSVDDLLLARIERVAVRAHFDLQILPDGRACLERVAAAAGHIDFGVWRMNLGFH